MPLVVVAPAGKVAASEPLSSIPGSRFEPLSPEWVEETARLARAEQADIAERKALGLIPPEPDPLSDAWSIWYQKNLRCETPNHQFFVRARGSRYCGRCIASMVIS